MPERWAEYLNSVVESDSKDGVVCAMVTFGCVSKGLGTDRLSQCRNARSIH